MEGEPSGSLDPAPPQRPARAGPRTVVDTLAIALLFYPLLLCLALFGEWFVAWHALGHPPRPSLDDPKDIIEIRTLHWATGVVMTGFLPAALLAISLNVLVAIRRRRRMFQLGLRVGIVVLAWSLVIGLVRWDPGRVVEWWFD